jgi:predicted ATP-binding protein involved in virulence
LNFSQLPDGIRSVLGLVVDFLRRRESYPWEPGDIGVRPSVLLYDEIDTHLHPQWQRRVLPALREALPDVQIIVSTHSPFVISSCPGARVHVFDLDKAGHATVRQPVDAPVGTSIAATIIDIFGVESRFDIHTEKKLERWKALKQSEEAGTISGKERKALERLTSELAAQSEELRRLVSPARNIDARRIAARLEREPA